ncbi:MAG: hypothetical protein AAF717_17290 [Bacteroidota bacterium]
MKISSNQNKFKLLKICALFFLILLAGASCSNDDENTEASILVGPLWIQLRTEFTNCNAVEDNVVQDLNCDGTNCISLKFREGIATYTERVNGIETIIDQLPYTEEENALVLQGITATFEFTNDDVLVITSSGVNGCSLIETWGRTFECEQYGSNR